MVASSASGRPAYDSASFGRRVAALGVDAAVIAIVLVAAVYGANAAFKPFPLFDPFWSRATPVHTQVEIASRQKEREDSGVLRETTISRETRVFADGTIRIFIVADSTFAAPNGTVSSTHVEGLIGRNGRDLIRRWLTVALFALAPFLYFAWMESAPSQGTIGKIVLGLKVTDLAGRRLTFGRSLFRQLMKYTELLSSGITYLIAAFTARGQALHDMFAGTLVVQSRPDVAGGAVWRAAP